MQEIKLELSIKLKAVCFLKNLPWIFYYGNVYITMFQFWNNRLIYTVILYTYYGLIYRLKQIIILVRN